MEIADDRHADAHPLEPLDDRGDRRRSLLVVDRHPHQLAAGARQRRPPARTVAGTSAVSVLVIDCTTIG